MDGASFRCMATVRCCGTPAFPVDGPELDALYEYPFMRLAHPSYKEPVPGFATIKDSIIVSRGCPGGCTFCGLGFHQGKFLSSRSVDSVLKIRRSPSPATSRAPFPIWAGRRQTCLRRATALEECKKMPSAELPMAVHLPRTRTQ